jgi:AraC-like DNA-binding protein
VNAFLGRIEDPEPSRFMSGSDLPIIDEPAFRAIMCICVMDPSLLRIGLGNEETSRLISSHNNLVESMVAIKDGRVVKHTGYRYIISFSSVKAAFSCARDIQKNSQSDSGKIAEKNIQVNISLSAGLPVSGQNELFGEAVQMAQRLCELANNGQVLVSSTVNDLLYSEGINGLEEEVKYRTFRPNDEEFMTRLVEVTASQWNDPELDIQRYCSEIGLSRSQFYRKTTSVTGLSPNNFLREYRLKRALDLIEKQKGNISEIAYKTGFNSTSYFSKCFKKQFGVLPSALTDNPA